MTQALQALLDQISATTAVQVATAKALESLAAQFAAVKDDPAKIQELVDKLKVSTDALQAALNAAVPPVVPPAA